MKQAVVSGIAFNRDEAKISLLGMPDKPGITYLISSSEIKTLVLIGEKHVELAVRSLNNAFTLAPQAA